MLKKIILSILFVGVIFAQESRFDTILKVDTLKVCIWSEYYGISYLDARTQKLIGIDSDLAVELAKDLEVSLEFVQSSFATLVEDVTTNRCDIAMFAIGNTPSRAKKMRFTTPHLSSDIYAVSTKSNQKINQWEDIDKPGVIVAVAKGTYHEPVMRSKLKKAELLVVNSYHAREQEVQSGRADVFMTDYPFGKRMIAQKNWAKLIEPPQTYHLTDYGWVVNYGDEKWYQRVEQFIKDIKTDGRLLERAKQNGLEPIVKLQ